MQWDFLAKKCWEKRVMAMDLLSSYPKHGDVLYFTEG